MSDTTKTVNAFVYNNCTKDARVLKEAASLTRAGYKVRIIAVIDNNVSETHEHRDGFEIFRVQRDSLHLKVFKWVNGFFRIFEFITLLPFRILGKVIAIVHRILQIILPKYFGENREGYVEEDTDEVTVLRMFRNPHRYTLRDYMNIAFFGESAFRKTVGYIFGIAFLPLYFLARIYFRAFNAVKQFVVESIRTIIMPYHRRYVFQDYYKKAAAFCNEHPSDILHFHDLNTLEVIDYLDDPSKYKKVYDSHELYTEIHSLAGKQRTKYKALEKRLIKKVDHVITVNQSIAEELTERYGVVQPTIVLNCPPKMASVPERTSLLADRAGLPQGETIILYQGGYSRGRGLEELIESMQYVDKGKLVMMGWGRIEESLKDLTFELHVNEKVVFVPPAEQSELLKYTCGAHIGVIPYKAVGLNNYYTSPNKLFEYVQAGVVIAGSFFPELKRFIGENDIGDFFDPEDPKSIAACLNKLVADPVRLKEMRENVKQAADKYHWGQEEKKLISIYEGLSDR